MNTLWQDLRYSTRMLLKQPIFTLAAVLSLALGIGANTSIFTVVQALLLTPLPYNQPDQLMSVAMADKSPKSLSGLWTMWSYPKYEVIRQRNQSFESVSAYQFTGATLTEGESAENLSGEFVAPSYFATLGVGTSQGRVFTEEENQPAPASSVIISHKLWQSHFSGAADLVGKTISFNKKQWQVIGIMAPGFRGQQGVADFWLPLKAGRKPDSPMLIEPNTYFLNVLARLKPGVSRERAESELSALNREMAAQWPWSKYFNGLTDNIGRLIPLKELKTDPIIRRSLIILQVAVGFVLLIACANVANLLLARGVRRRKELAIRLALGASRAQLARLFLTESLLIAVAGGVLGLLLALWGVDFLNDHKPQASGSAFWANYSQSLSFFTIQLDKWTLLFNFGTAILTGVLFGLAPVFQASQTHVTEALKQGAGATGFGRRFNLRSVLVVLEVALAFALFAGAGLMIRSFQKLQQVQLGFEPTNVLTFAAWGQTPEFHQQLRENLAALPDVESVAMASGVPLNGVHSSQPLEISGREQEREQNIDLFRVNVHAVSQEYFATLHIPILRGRGFTTEDRAGGKRVAIINESAANRFWPGQDPIGQHIKIGAYEVSEGEKWAEIVGIAANVRYSGLEDTIGADVYNADVQLPEFAENYFVRTRNNPKASFGAVRTEIRQLNKYLPVTPKTLSELYTAKLSRTTFSGGLLLLFSGIALLLAALGIYSVLAHFVSERTREIGVRIALGASTRDVMKLIGRQGLKLILPGIVIGLGAALLLTKFMTAMLYGIGSTDPITFAGITVLLLLIALLACYFPARRATKVDPIIALRCE